MVARCFAAVLLGPALFGRACGWRASTLLGSSSYDPAMTMQCMIEVEVDGHIQMPVRTYALVTIPRIGEMVALEWDGSSYPEFVVTQVIHVPDGLQDQPAFVVVRAIPRRAPARGR
jgi:hypothetical protein